MIYLVVPDRTVFAKAMDQQNGFAFTFDAIRNAGVEILEMLEHGK